MKRAQVSIFKLMVVVVAVAFNLASMQFWAHSSDPGLLTGRVFISLALQAGLYGLIRSRGTKFHLFWIGFELFGLAAAVMTIYIDFFSPDDSALLSLMDEYLSAAYGFVSRGTLLIKDPYYQSKVRAALLANDGSFTPSLTWELIAFLPQFSIALIGGLLASAAMKFGRFGRAHDPRPDVAPVRTGDFVTVSDNR